MEHAGVDDGSSVEATDGVHLTQLTVGTETSSQAFAVEPGARVPTHAHPHEQTGVVYEGELTLIVEDESIPVGAGETFTIPGGQAHAVENRGDVTARGVDVFAPPRPDPDWAV